MRNVNSERQAREILTRILRDASVFYLRNKELETAFIEGHYDASFNEVEIDSLAIMEICLSLEVGWGSELVPDDILSVETIGKLACMLLEK